MEMSNDQIWKLCWREGVEVGDQLRELSANK